jgi:hypothetical protein
VKKGLGLLLFVPALVAFIPRQEPTDKFAKYMGEKGWIYVRNYEIIRSTQTGNVVITGEGRPIEIQDTGNGMTITGRNVRIVLEPGQDGTMVLKEATVSGGARAIYDSDLYYRTAVEMATTLRPAPPKPIETSLVTLDSENMVFARQGDEGVLTFPQATKVVVDTKGSQVRDNAPTTYTQTLNIDGSKGRFTVLMSPESASGNQFVSPRTGRLDGPVTIHLVRNESVASTPDLPRVERTDLTGTTDLVEFDLNTETPNMTFTGNVHIRGQAQGLPGEVRGDKGVINIDRTFKVTSYEFTGNPTKTRVKVDEARPGGGR